VRPHLDSLLELSSPHYEPSAHTSAAVYKKVKDYGTKNTDHSTILKLGISSQCFTATYELHFFADMYSYVPSY
jgi:hypothetical protein